MKRSPSTREPRRLVATGVQSLAFRGDTLVDQVALDAAGRRFAVATDDAVHVVTL